jgi:uncharacterized membrane protein YhdT
MSELGDRTIMTLIVTTGVLGLVGWIVAAGVYRPPEWVPWFAFPVLFAVLVIVLVAFVWEGLDLMD